MILPVLAALCSGAFIGNPCNGDGGIAAIRAAQLVFFDDQVGLVGAGGEQRGGFGDGGCAGVFADGFGGVRHGDDRQFGGRVEADASSRWHRRLRPGRFRRPSGRWRRRLAHRPAWPAPAPALRRCTGRWWWPGCRGRSRGRGRFSCRSSATQSGTERPPPSRAPSSAERPGEVGSQCLSRRRVLRTARPLEQHGNRASGPARTLGSPFFASFLWRSKERKTPLNGGKQRLNSSHTVPHGR